MSLSCGFYNSVNHDRKYDAIQISHIFDGIIEDGVYMSIGDQLNVKAGSGMTITVGTGRAWFNHTWTLNDSLLPVEIPLSEVILNRIDAVVLEVNAEETVRGNTIKVVKGEPATNPSIPTMVNTSTVHQYPLAYISVKAGTTEIRQADITSMIGKETTPYVTGILDTINIENMVAQWKDQWQAFFEAETMDMASTNALWKTQWEAWYRMYTNSSGDEFSTWMNQKKESFEAWLAQLQSTLDGDTAARLTNAVIELQRRAEVLEQFSTDLSVEHAVYAPMQDSDGDPILDSDSGIIKGEVIFVIK